MYPALAFVRNRRVLSEAGKNLIGELLLAAGQLCIDVGNNLGQLVRVLLESRRNT